MLEELLGGGKSTPAPSNSSNTQPTTQPSSPSASEPPSGTTDPAEDETAEDDMPVDHDDGTYSPAPAAGETGDSRDVAGADEPAADTAVSEPVASNEQDIGTQAPDQGTPLAANTPKDSDDTVEADKDNDSELSAPPAPVGASPVASAPAGGNIPSPEEAAEDSVTNPAVATTRGDPVTRITDLIAGYEKLLSEPAADENGQARTRAMELAQNRVLTSLLGDLSTSDARLSLLDDANDRSGQISLIEKYYAEAGR